MDILSYLITKHKFNIYENVLCTITGLLKHIIYIVKQLIIKVMNNRVKRNLMSYLHSLSRHSTGEYPALQLVVLAAFDPVV